MTLLPRGGLRRAEGRDVAGRRGGGGLARRIRGAARWGDSRVTVAAPGTDILTTQLGGDYRFVSGTSASAPLVAGIAELVKTVRPSAPAAAHRHNATVKISPETTV